MKLKYIFLFSATLLMGTACSDFWIKSLYRTMWMVISSRPRISWNLIVIICMVCSLTMVRGRALLAILQLTTTVMI